MTTNTALQTAHDLLTAWTIQESEPETNRLDVVLDADNLLVAVGVLDKVRWGYLAGITGLDLGVKAEIMEVLYHFCSRAAILTLRVRIARDHASVPSITDVLPTASFYERELHEMMGIDVVGLSNLDHLFLPDDWPDNTYPLRKDARLE